MLRNVEIKAKVQDIQAFLEKVKSISKCGEILKQEDTYFCVPSGRLKLREIQEEPACLIFYDRPNIEGPKLSSYSKQILGNAVEAKGLKEVLKMSLGIKGIVRKERLLFMVGQTRIHVDDVENLGHFMELEVTLSSNESLDYGQNIADKLMNKLGISQENLLSGSYIDMLLEK